MTKKQKKQTKKKPTKKTKQTNKQTDNAINLSKLELISCRRRKERENVCERVKTCLVSLLIG